MLANANQELQVLLLLLIIMSEDVDPDMVVRAEDLASIVTVSQNVRMDACVSVFTSRKLSKRFYH